jgi:hypothetical protein
MSFALTKGEGKGRVYNFGISVGALLSSLFTGANSINIHTCPRPEGARGNRIRGGMADYNDNCPSGNGDILHTYNTVYLMPLCRIIDFKGQTNKLSLSGGKVALTRANTPLPPYNDPAMPRTIKKVERKREKEKRRFIICPFWLIFFLRIFFHPHLDLFGRSQQIYKQRLITVVSVHPAWQRGSKKRQCNDTY